jgi:hypothetical protein
VTYVSFNSIQWLKWQKLICNHWIVTFLGPSTLQLRIRRPG